MYEVIGREWDEMAVWSNDLKKEIFVQTCTWSIAIWEWVYGFEPDESMTLEERRQRILSKIRGVRPINPEVLRRGIAAVSGVNAAIKDFTAPYSFGVTLHITNKSIPYDRVFQYIYEHKPAHLTATTESVFPQMESTLYVGGQVSVVIRLPIPEQPDEFDFLSRINAGGHISSAARIPVPEHLDEFNPESELSIGGGAATLVKLPVQERMNDLTMQSKTSAGGNMALRAKLPIVEYYTVTS